MQERLGWRWGWSDERIECVFWEDFRVTYGGLAGK